MIISFILGLIFAFSLGLIMAAPFYQSVIKEMTSRAIFNEKKLKELKENRQKAIELLGRINEAFEKLEKAKIDIDKQPDQFSPL